MTVRRLQHASVPRPPGEGASAQAVRFYHDILGCDELPKPATFSEIDVTWFGCGDAEIHVFAAGDAEAAPDTGAHFCLVVDDLASMRTSLDRAGFECHDTTPIPGRPRFYTHDPFGNMVEITTIEGDYRAGSG